MSFNSFYVFFDSSIIFLLRLVLDILFQLLLPENCGILSASRLMSS